MPFFGLSHSLALIQLGSAIAGIAIFEMYNNIFEFFTYFETNKVINYNMILPLSSKNVY